MHYFCHLHLKKKSPFAFVLCHQEAHEASLFFQERALIPEKAAKDQEPNQETLLLQKKFFSQFKIQNQTTAMCLKNDLMN